MRSLVEKARLAVYASVGKFPVRRDYALFKMRSISKELTAKTFSCTRLPNGYGAGLDERIVEYPWLFEHLTPAPGVLLDAGSVLNFEYLLDQPQLSSKQVFISTLAPECENFNRRGVSYVYEDFRRSCFRDEHFDLIVCLSTLEHVGMDNTAFYTSDIAKQENCPDAYLYALQELRRTLKPGGRLFLSFPFGEYAHHRWLQVFDCAMLDRLICAFAPQTLQECHFRYDDFWRVSSRPESAKARYVDRTRTPYAPGAISAEAVVCICLTK